MLKLNYICIVKNESFMLDKEIFRQIFSLSEKWAKNVNSDQQFIRNLHAEVQIRTNGKLGWKDLTSKQLSCIKDKVNQITTKGLSK